MKACLRLLSITLLCGCASFSQRANRVELGMTAQQVEHLLGRNYRVKAARTEPDNSTTRLLEFTDTRSNEVVLVFLKNNRVVQFGTPDALEKLPAGPAPVTSPTQH